MWQWWVELAWVGSGYTGLRGVGVAKWQCTGHPDHFWQCGCTWWRTGTAETNKCTDSIRIAIMFKYINSYIGPQWPITTDCAIAWNKRLTFLSSPVRSRNVDELSTVLLHTGVYRKVEQVFYSTVHSMMMGHWGPKHVGVDTVKHNCNCNE